MPISLEQEIEVEKLKLYLEAYPHRAIELAINHFSDWLEERNHNQQLLTQYEQLQKDCAELVDCLKILIREKQ